MVSTVSVAEVARLWMASEKIFPSLTIRHGETYGRDRLRTIRAADTILLPAEQLTQPGGSEGLETNIADLLGA